MLALTFALTAIKILTRVAIFRTVGYVLLVVKLEDAGNSNRCDISIML